MAYLADQNRGASADEAQDAFVGQPRVRPGASAPRTQPRPPAEPQIRPAHPLPSVRSGSIDYDRYLEQSTSRFKIFSAEESRRRKRAVATGVAVAALVVLVIVWAVASQTA